MTPVRRWSVTKFVVMATPHLTPSWLRSPAELTRTAVSAGCRARDGR
jgi:hypothetical protein